MRYLKWGLVVVAMFVVGATIWIVQKQKVESKNLPVFGKLDSFQLFDQENTLFDSSNLKGHVSVVNFIFTSCAHVCPVLTRQMAKIQEKTKEITPEVKLVSISVDPLKDTPDKLREYGSKFGADFRRWVFLTGPIDVIREVVVKGFMNSMGYSKTAGAREPDLFEITHGENFVILDRQGDIRAFRQAKSERDINAILKIVIQLSKENSAQLTQN